MKKLLFLLVVVFVMGACSKEEEKPACEETNTGSFCVTSVQNQTLQMKFNGGIFAVLDPGEEVCFEFIPSQPVVLSFETVVTGNPVGDNINFFLEVCDELSFLF